MMDDMKLARGIAAGFLIALAFGWTYTYDTDTPLGGDAPSSIDDHLRLIKDAVQERMNIDHYWPLTGTEVSDTDAGYHRDIHFRSTTGTDPILGVEAVSGTDELKYIDSDGTSIYLTSGGILNSCNLTGTQTVAGDKTFSGTVTATSPVINTGVSGTAILDEDDMASDSDTKLATQQSIKAYVSSCMSAYVSTDSDNNTMLKSHAYLAQTDGFVSARDNLDDDETLRGFVGQTDDPVGAGTTMAYQRATGDSVEQTIFFAVAKGEYFEIVSKSPSIYWKSIGTLGSPVDQD